MLLTWMELALEAKRAARKSRRMGRPRTERLESRTLLTSAFSPLIDLGTVEGSRAYYGYVNAGTRPIEYHSVTLEASGTLTASIQRMTSNADLFLVKDANHNGRIDSGELLATSTHPGTQSDWVVKSLSAGTYYIGVVARGGATWYSLALIADYAGNNLAAARSFGTLSTGGATASDF